MLKILIWMVFVIQIITVRCYPTIKQGILAITGISSCGQSNGYCFVDVDCTSEKDFLPDHTGHCDRLKVIYSPSSSFSCCRLTSDNESKIETTKQADTTTISAIRSSMVEKIDNLSSDVKQEKSFRLSNGLSDLTRQDASFSAKNIHYELELESYDNDTALDENNSRMLKPSDVMKSSITPQIVLSNITHSNRNISDGKTAWSVEDFKFNHNVTSPSTTSENLTCIGFPQISGHDAKPENSISSSGERLPNFFNNLESEKCLNITYTFENDVKCINIWKFINAKGVLLCFGALLNPVWLLTSATCISKIVKETLESVLVFDVKEKKNVYGISSVIVHENYAMHQKTNANNIGLVSLNKVVTGGCFVCLPVQDSKYLDKICSIYEYYGNSTNESLYDAEKLVPKCQDKLKALSIDSKMYLSMFCPTKGESTTGKTRSGSILWCRNTLIGIETSKNHEDFRIFTPINEFADWILRNIQIYS